jgi:hypothetical protein
MYSYFEGPVALSEPRTIVYRYDLTNCKLEVRVQDAIRQGDKIGTCQVRATPRLVDVAGQLRVRPKAIARALEKEEGASVQSGERIASRTGLLGIGKHQALVPVAGVLKAIMVDEGAVVIRPVTRLETVTAHLSGRVIAIGATGITLQIYGRLVYGIVGTGGVVSGILLPLSNSAVKRQDSAMVPGGVRAAANILALQSPPTLDFVQRVVGTPAQAGVIAIVAPSIAYRDYIKIRQELPHLTLIIVEGFGHIPMSDAAWAVLSGAAGKTCSVSAEVDLAGGKRPFIILPEEPPAHSPVESRIMEPRVGAQVRTMRGLQIRYGRIVRHWSMPRHVASGYRTESIEVHFDDGSTGIVPIDNVEVLTS